ncbi:winged helix-turn-helix transcriptional regulator [Spirillospora sp. CA-294931]|uniref:winged helix-turn-helix transcriptional regulator n=1 Tax=Spirillospora sp. CA-294931 TaxID=3240042 RepID=UPI003D94F035
MTSKRRYEDRCGIAQALNVVGERWALLIVRDLVFGPKRFTDLQAGLPGVGSNRLTQRLHELEATGVLRRRALPPPAASQVYELTEWGRELDPILSALGVWGLRSPIEPEGGLGADSAMLGLRGFFDAGVLPAWTAVYEIRLGRDRFVVDVVDGHLTEVTRSQGEGSPDAVLETDPLTIGSLLGDRRAAAAALDSGDLTVTGDIKAVRHLLDALTGR